MSAAVQQGAVTRAERRQHTRFDLSQTGSGVSWIQERSADLAFDPRRLLNVSFGGMCCRVDKPPVRGTVHPFLIVLKGDLEGPVIVKARIQWIQESGPSTWTVGATFVESSNGWFGPDTEGQVFEH